MKTLLLDSPVFAGMKKEGTVFARFEVLNLSDIQSVVTGRMYIGNTPNEIGNRPVDDGHVQSRHEWNLEIFLRRSGEVGT